MADRLSVDDFIARRREQAETLTVVLSERPDDDARVTVTPHIPGLGCHCGVGLPVRRDAIAAVITRDDSPAGVVDIEFADQDIAEMFKAHVDYVRRSSARMVSNRSVGFWPTDKFGSPLIVNTETLSTGFGSTIVDQVIDFLRKLWCENMRSQCAQDCVGISLFGGDYEECIRICNENYNRCIGSH